MKGVPVKMGRAKYLNMIFSAGKFARAKQEAELKDALHIRDTTRSRWANKPGAHHKVNPPGTKAARLAEEHRLTLRW